MTVTFAILQLKVERVKSHTSVVETAVYSCNSSYQSIWTDVFHESHNLRVPFQRIFFLDLIHVLRIFVQSHFANMQTREEDGD